MKIMLYLKLIIIHTCTCGYLTPESRRDLLTPSRWEKIQFQFFNGLDPGSTRFYDYINGLS